MKKRYIVGISLVAVLLALVIGCGVYVGDYYSADKTAATAMAGSERVSVQKMDKMTVFSPENPTAGLLFYPGGKVEYSAYAPLMLALAERDVLCVLIPIGLLPRAAFRIRPQIQKVQHQTVLDYSWWGRTDSNHRSETQQIYSLSPLATRELPHIQLARLRVTLWHPVLEPVDGLEPPTY